MANQYKVTVKLNENDLVQETITLSLSTKGQAKAVLDGLKSTNDVTVEFTKTVTFDK